MPSPTEPTLAEVMQVAREMGVSCLSRKEADLLLAAADAWEAVRVNGWDVVGLGVPATTFVVEAWNEKWNRMDVLTSASTPLAAVRAALGATQGGPDATS